MVVSIIADAWAPYLGRQLAEERARDAATILLLKPDLGPKEVADTLTRCFFRVVREPYNLNLSGSTVIDAVNDAIEALADHAAPGLRSDPSDPQNQN